MTTENRSFNAKDRSAAAEGVTDAFSDVKVHLLDIGKGKGHQYGDCLACQFGDKSVLIDGGHRGDEELVLSQLEAILKQTRPVRVSLIITTHPHDDHIGCLPELVEQGLLETDWALVCDPQYRWGKEGDTDSEFAVSDAHVEGIAEALLEHDRSELDDDELASFIDSVPSLKTRYRNMLKHLNKPGTTVVRHATDAAAEEKLLEAFADVGLEVIGPSLEQLQECFRLVQEEWTDTIRAFDSTADVDLESAAGVANAYRSLVAGGFTDAPPPNRGKINLQSLVTRFDYKGHRFIFAGDMQFAAPQVESQMLEDGVREMRKEIRARAPYAFVKLSHHGSYNAFNSKTMPDYGDTELFGICCGDFPGDHPNPSVLKLLDKNRDNIDWVRTDRNGLVSITFNPSGPRLKLSRGKKDDATPSKPAPRPFTDVELAPPGAGVSVTGDSEYTFTARVPRNATRLTVTLDLQP